MFSLTANGKTVFYQLAFLVIDSTCAALQMLKAKLMSYIGFYLQPILAFEFHILILSHHSVYPYHLQLSVFEREVVSPFSYSSFGDVYHPVAHEETQKLSLTIQYPHPLYYIHLLSVISAITTLVQATKISCLNHFNTICCFLFYLFFF